MARKWADLKKRLLGPEDLETVDREVKEELARINFAELRRETSITQEQLALALGMSQSDVSKVERRKDMRLSTALKYLEAIGARVEVVVGRKRLVLNASHRTTGRKE